MHAWLVDHAPQIHYWALLAAFGGVACWEAVSPSRRLARIAPRWASAITLTAIVSMVVVPLLPAALIGTSLLAQARGFGLLRLADLPQPVAIALGVVAMDLGRYLEHRCVHQVPLLWRLHQVHHSDPEYDASTGLRFHPLEAAFGLTLRASVIVAFGIAPIAVLVYEVVNITAAAWAHANVRIAAETDRWLRRVLVTPGLHSIHHSRAPADANRNFSAVTPIWDRLFGTYADDTADRAPVRYGLRGFDASRAYALGSLLALPFRRRPQRSAAKRLSTSR